MECRKDCVKCKKINVRTDNLGYPYGYDCLRYGDSVFKEDFASTKTFKNNGYSDYKENTKNE